MAWIKVIDELNATGLLKKIYSEIKKKRGKLSNIMMVQSLNPEAMRLHLDLYVSLMFGRSGLKREERELLGVVVSLTNHCDYCVEHHARALNYYWKDDDKIKKLKKDPMALDFNERTRRMVEYAVKLTREPEKVEEKDIERLREVGFSDPDILDINLITSYFNFVNRIVLGLGVEFTPDEVEGYKY